MSRLKILPGVLALFASSLACVTIMGPSRSAVDTPAPPIPAPTMEQIPTIEAATEEPAAEGTSCPKITERIMENTFASTDDSADEGVDFGARDNNDADYIITYVVKGDKISEPFKEDVPADLQDEQADTPAHQRIWESFAELIPARDRATLAEFSIVTDGPDKVLAAVSQSYNDPDRWSLKVDIADTQDPYSLTYTFIHEYAHLLTLGPEQVPPDLKIFDHPYDDELYKREAASCPNFFTGEGCANAGSYINEFFARFWVDIYDEWHSIDQEKDDDVYYKRLSKFYHKHHSQFVTDYAVTDPAEDIAESFAFYVLNPGPEGDTIADQKIGFFYQYAELAALRARIRGNLCAALPE